MTEGIIAAILVGWVFFLAFGMAMGMAAVRQKRPTRARTCGTCIYSHGDGDYVREGYCTRHAYRPPVRSTQANLFTATHPSYPASMLGERPRVGFDWPGCGESEER